MGRAAALILLCGLCVGYPQTPAPGPTGPTGASGPSGATVPKPTPPTATLTCGPGAPPVIAPGFSYFKGHVRAANRTGVADVQVRARRKDQSTTSVLTSSFGTPDPGCYATQLLPVGTYDLIFQKAGYLDAVVSDQVLKDGPPAELDAFVRRGTDESSVPPQIGILLVIAFVVSIYVTRWYNIAAPNRRSLIARIDDLRLRLTEAGMTEREKQVSKLGTYMTSASLSKVGDFLFWSRGQEVSAWVTIHYAELELLKAVPLSPERVAARLATNQQQLVSSDDPMSKAMAARIKQAADCNEPKTTPAEFQELMLEVQYHLYGLTDNAFAQLTGWQTKAIWLTLVGLMLILALATAEGNWTLFVVGAAGGFLSRMSQQLKRANLPTDYGASWSTLFLSPVLGALTGWFGVLMIHVASNPPFDLVGGPFKMIRWEEPMTPGTLFGAFLLGFSERLFDSIMQRLELQIDKRDEAAKKPPETPIPAVKLGAPPTDTLSPKQAAPGLAVTAKLAQLDSSKVTKVLLIAADNKETEAPVTAKPSATSVTFTVPDVAKGPYKVRIMAPTAMDADTLDVTSK